MTSPKLPFSKRQGSRPARTARYSPVIFDDIQFVRMLKNVTVGGVAYRPGQLASFPIPLASQLIATGSADGHQDAVCFAQEEASGKSTRVKRTDEAPGAGCLVPDWPGDEKLPPALRDLVQRFRWLFLDREDFRRQNVTAGLRALAKATDARPKVRALSGSSGEAVRGLLSLAAYRLGYEQDALDPEGWNSATVRNMAISALASLTKSAGGRPRTADVETPEAQLARALHVYWKNHRGIVAAFGEKHHANQGADFMTDLYESITGQPLKARQLRHLKKAAG